MDQIHFVPREPARHIPKPALEPWQAAAVAKFREIQRESAALVGQTVTLADRTARLVRQRSDQRIHREQYLRSGAATDVGLAKIDEKLAALESLIVETSKIRAGQQSCDVHGLRSAAFKALVQTGCIDEDFEGEEL